jgi:hypothetical protein
MQLLTETMDINELMRLRILFESNGIAIYVSNEDSARNFGFIYPARKYGIFVVYENQLEDARALLENEDYEVQNPINLEAHRAYLEQQAPESTKKIFNVLMNIIVISACVVIALVLYFKISSA